jgi:hypothetical protein
MLLSLTCPRFVKWVTTVSAKAKTGQRGTGGNPGQKKHEFGNQAPVSSFKMASEALSCWEEENKPINQEFETLVNRNPENKTRNAYRNLKSLSSPT